MPALAVKTGSSDAVRKQLARALDWEDAHIGFDEAVKGLPPGVRGRRPRGFPHSPWELLEHLRLAQWDLLDFCVNPDYVAGRFPDDYWPKGPRPPRPKSWDESVAAFRADRKALKALVLDRKLDLAARIPHGEGQTYLREILLVIDHGAYHVGQLVMARKLLGTWPPG
ncbi:MAG: DinB family protein [Acidithiobacillales bacterium]